MYNREGELVVKTSISGSINSVSISDEGVAVVGSSEDKVVILDAGGNKLAELPAGDVITSVHITGGADYVAYADYSGKYYVGSLKGRELWSAKEAGAGRQIRFSPDGKHLYAASDKGAVYQYEVGHLLEKGKQAAFRQKAIQYGSIAAAVLLAVVLIFWTVKRTPHLYKRLWKDKYAYIMLLPSFSLLLVFLYYPSLSGLFHSLYDWNPGSRSTFVGLDNFRRMLDDPYVSKGTVNLLILVVTGLFKTLIPPLIVAELIYHLRNSKAQYLFRTSFVISMVIPSVGFLLVWQNLYDPNIGLINQILNIMGLGSFAHPWLGDADTALWAIIFMGFPFIGIMQLLVMYSGLIAISDEVIEAAKLDGAKSFRIIRSIHLPLLAGQFKLLIVLALIGIVQDFGSILIVTGGGQWIPPTYPLYRCIMRPRSSVIWAMLPL
ncbi:ABC transporter permease subunit [Paenibacillus sp. CC-CFT747]|nr:ABC transporter permease subunit [Paenibacillus sp. CC-CFT747]